MKQINMSQDQNHNQNLNTPFNKSNNAFNSSGNNDLKNSNKNAPKGRDVSKISNKNQMVATRAPKMANLKKIDEKKGKKEGGCNIL